jgi:DNA-binding response OmpR family regulator
MTAKHVLLIHEDRLLGNMFRERLENDGYSVQSVRTGEAGLHAASQRRPDLIVLDSVTPSPEPAEIIAAFRGQDATSALPIIVLPTSRPQIAETIEHAGATKVLRRSINPMAELIDTIETALGLRKTATLAKSLPYHPDESWLHLSLESAPETLAALRRTLHAVSREPGDTVSLRDLFQRIHGFAEQMAMLGQQPIFQFASAMEALAFDLHRRPEHVNASTLNTLGQSIDFLATVLGDHHRNHLRDPMTAQALVVDDEDGARKIISAAMRLVNLNAITADTPDTALKILREQKFDIVFLDVGLPEMTGFEVCTKARSIPLHEKTPIVFITGMTTFQNRVQSSLSGGNDFVGKPFNLAELGLKALLWVFKGQLCVL